MIMSRDIGRKHMENEVYDILKKKNIEINWKGRPETVTIREMTTDEWLTLRQKCNKIVYQGRIPRTESDERKAVLETLKICIVKAPFDRNEDTLKKLPKLIAEQLYADIDALNTLGGEKKK